MWVALLRLGDCDIGRLPVVCGDTDWTVMGVLQRMDIIHAYNRLSGGEPKSNIVMKCFICGILTPQA